MKTVADAAVVAFASWKQTTAYERAALLGQWNHLVLQHVDELARLIATEMGKPVAEARGEVRYAASFIEWYAEEAKRSLRARSIPSQFANKRLLVVKQPIGPVYAITPWNFPAAMVTRKVAPALAAGCTVILKPAEQSALTAIRLRELWDQAGGPPGVFQIVTGDDPAAVSAPFIADPRIRKLTFTGSTKVGKLLYAQCAPTMKRLSLELGGHAPFLIFEDADLDAAVQEVCNSKFRNAGQTCLCVNRVCVHEKIHQEFTRRFVDAVRLLKIGDPLDESTQVGPLVDAAGLSKVTSHVKDAVSKGAQIATGRSPLEGLFFEPTVLTEVKPGMRILEEETFGPVAPITSFRLHRRSHPFGEQRPLWLGRLSLDPRPRPGFQSLRGARLRHHRRQRRLAIHCAGSFRRIQGLRHRARGWQMGAR